ncbi:hypothetical protein ANN_20345 [Periplaneta americana]|uniref:Uncharacterized protein n=1 Tax=Periplaneta americana TaxID=6978 RepID=A0ABQ8SCC3_PERAM|nr:hypothetical protein ANN_20345 [Periplaneta americana]
MIMSRDQNIVRNGNIKIGNLSFEKFKYLGATVTNINDTLEEMKHRINMGNACYYSVEKLLSSNLLSKNLKVRIYKTVILPVVLYGCETWTLTLREEQRLRVFENTVLRKIFGAKRDEVTGEWRKLHNTELHALYSSPDIIRNIKSRRLRWAGHVARMGESRNAYIVWAGHVAHMGESRNAYSVLVGRPEGKRPLGRPRRRWEVNIKMDLREVGYDDREWINLAQDGDQWRAYVRAAMNLRNNSCSDPSEWNLKTSEAVVQASRGENRTIYCEQNAAGSSSSARDPGSDAGELGTACLMDGAPRNGFKTVATKMTHTISTKITAGNNSKHNNSLCESMQTGLLLCRNLNEVNYILGTSCYFSDKRQSNSVAEIALLQQRQISRNIYPPKTSETATVRYFGGIRDGHVYTVSLTAPRTTVTGRPPVQPTRTAIAALSGGLRLY